MEVHKEENQIKTTASTEIYKIVSPNSTENTIILKPRYRANRFDENPIFFSLVMAIKKSNIK